MARTPVLVNLSFRFGERWTKLAFFGCWCLILTFPSRAQQQPASARLSESQFISLARRCAPGAPTDTLLAIARTESDLYPNSISINRPETAARRAGYTEGQLVLLKQPRDRPEATHWLHWFAAHRLTVSIGLMQVNVETAVQFGVTPEQLLEPCTNLKVGASILIAAYTTFAREMGQGLAALDAALSFYNTGNSKAGLRNGYVADVYAHAPNR